MGGVRAVLCREDTVTAENEHARLTARVRKLELEVKDLQQAVAALVLAVHGKGRGNGAR